MKRLGTITILLAALGSGCTTSLQPADLGGIYDRAAGHHDEHRNPIIVIPGILGSRLRDAETGRVVWGAFEGSYANPTRADGARLVALPMEPGVPLAALRDDVRPDGALDRVRLNLLGVPIELAAYAQILVALGAGGYRDEGLGLAGAIDYGDDHFTCFQFDYDWRRDNVENARRLHEFILQKRAYVQARRQERFGVGQTDVKFDIVAHSMGGLITRYYLRYGDRDLPSDGTPPPVTWAGAEHVERAILVGTPSAGSARALLQLVDGVSLAPVLPKYEPALLGTMPSVYQLLPRPRHRAVRNAGDPESAMDLFDPALWAEQGWGLAAPDQDGVLARILPGVMEPDARRRIALDHQGKCVQRARRFAEALDTPAPRPCPTRLHLVAGDAQATPAVITVDRRGRLRIDQRAPGDGTVIRSSALMDERVGGPWQPRLVSPVPWSGVLFLFSDHLGLTRDPAFTDNVLFMLLEEQTREQSD